MRHDEKPEAGDLSDEQFEEEVEGILTSEYAVYVSRLRPHVRGKVVATSVTGSSGFLLRFTDGSWAATFLDEDRLLYEVGAGEPPQAVLGRLDSPAAGDGSPPLEVDLPYAGEACDMAAEVARCHGQPVVGLAYGDECFNFCFPRGLELETMILLDNQGRVALRVFWEQW